MWAAATGRRWLQDKPSPPLLDPSTRILRLQFWSRCRTKRVVQLGEAPWHGGVQLRKAGDQSLHQRWASRSAFEAVSSNLPGQGALGVSDTGIKRARLPPRFQHNGSVRSSNTYRSSRSTARPPDDWPDRIQRTAIEWTSIDPPRCGRPRSIRPRARGRGFLDRTEMVETTTSPITRRNADRSAPPTSN